MSRIFLTGASGFIAKHILRELLERGHAVRASVRSETRQAEVAALFPGADLDFARLDLERDAGWAEAMQGCDALIHTASPFPMRDPRDPQDLIRPAVEGTRRALDAAIAAGIGRVVLTSSVAAIYKDAAKPPAAPSDEANWTRPDAPFVTAYEASKTLAERAAWDIAAATPGLALTVVNPGFVVGPPMDARFGTSLDLVARIMAGSDPLAPPLTLPVVDVRDVARMHVDALDLEAAAGARFAAVAETMSFADMARVLRAWDPSLRPATRVAPTWLLRVLALGLPEMRTVVKGLGRNMHVSGARAAETFGLAFIPGRDALIASAEAVRRARA